MDRYIGNVKGVFWLQAVGSMPGRGGKVLRVRPALPTYLPYYSPDPDIISTIKILSGHLYASAMAG